MKITDAKPVGGVERVTSSDPPVVTQPKDRVTVSESREVQASVASAQGSANRARPGRLKEIEQQVRAGAYHPDPSRVAEEILQEAEVEARLQSLLRH